MLRRLSISNYALIDHTEVDWHSGLSVITGETGAGKSILLGALSLLLGGRADAAVLRNADKKSVVEGHFQLTDSQKSFFEENNLDFEADCIIRREIQSNGKSRAFINDTPVNLTQLRSLTATLVDLNLQHENLRFLEPAFQLSALDAFAGNQSLVADYGTAYKTWQTAEKTLAELIEAKEKNLAETDFLKFQFEELEAAELKSNAEQETLEEERKLLESAGEILKNLEQATEGLDDEILPNMGRLSIAFDRIGDLSPDLAEFKKRIRSIFIEMQDLSEEMNKAGRRFEANPEKLNRIEDRLTTIYKLQQKHRVGTVSELIEIKQQIDEKLQTFGDIDHLIEKAQKTAELAKKEAFSKGQILSDQRKYAIPAFEKGVMSLFEAVSMPKASIQMEQEISATPSSAPNGFDKIRLLFSANTGMKLQAVEQVASGGELSRLTLCIKTLISGKMNMPTLIFDEIDTGISGDAALKVGKLMRKLGEGLQVISISHLPQIAAAADTHYLVYKYEENGQTHSSLKALNESERIDAIASITGGSMAGDAGKILAKQLLDASK